MLAKELDKMQQHQHHHHRSNKKTKPKPNTKAKVETEDTHYRNNTHHVREVKKTKMKIIVITNLKMGIKTEVIQVTQMKMGKHKKKQRDASAKGKKEKLSILIQHIPFIDDVFDFVAAFLHRILPKYRECLKTYFKFTKRLSLDQLQVI